MNLYQQKILKARKEFLNLNLKQERELLRIYQELAKELSSEIASCRTSSSKQYLSEMENLVQAYMNELNSKLNNVIKSNIKSSSQISSAVSLAYYESITNDVKLRSMFNKSVISASSNTVKKLIQGKYYEDGKTLDQRIWNITRKNAKDIDTLIKTNIARGANARKLAQQVERYINPAKRIEAKTLEAGMSKSIPYQAQRLARTSITHAFAETTIENSKNNPFNLGIKWNLSDSHYVRQVKRWGKDICDKYATQNDYKLGIGVFALDRCPMQHANCLCYLTEENLDIDKAIEELKGWSNGKDNPKLDKWYKENNENTDLDDSISDIIKDKKLSETVDKFKKLNVTTYDSRRELGRDILDVLELNDIPVSVRKIDAHGYCSLNYGNNSDITEYVLNSKDIRNNNYKIKTAFHEAYHAKAKGMASDYFSIKKEWLQIEETFAESSCHFMVKQLGIIEEISPSYPDKLVEMLPRLKQLEKFKDCNTIADFGEIAWVDRLSGVTPTWANLYDECMKVKHDWQKYSIQYFDYINSNVEDLVTKMLNNMPEYNNYKNQMIEDCKIAMKDIEDGAIVTGNEKMVIQNVLAITMNRLGVK